MIEKLPQNLKDKIVEVKNLLSPHTKRAYLVGGCVRDLLLGIEIKDLDIEVYDITPDKFDKIMIEVGAIGVGKSFFVYKYNDVDLALPRVERKAGVGHKAFEVEVVSDEKEASKRRDFTMNAMMLNIFTEELLDFWDGKNSIENKQISLIDETAFKEDSLRVLRAIQFSARFGFEIEKNTLHVMKQISLEDLSKTRILWEFEKLFDASYLSLGFTYMYRLNLFEKLFTCKINQEKIKLIKTELDSIEEVKELKLYYFFYIIANMSKNDPIKWLKAIDAPNHYIRSFKNQPFFTENISDFDLHVIAIDTPIKNWLGNYKKEVVRSAKRLNVYDEVYTGGEKIADVIKDGFKKEAIKIEYRRRIMKRIQ